VRSEYTEPAAWLSPADVTLALRFFLKPCAS
jgi:hypothetical protein